MISTSLHARANWALHGQEHVQEQRWTMHVQEQATKQRQCKLSKQSKQSKRSKQIHEQAHAPLHMQIGRCKLQSTASNASIVTTASGANKCACRAEQASKQAK